MPNYGEKQFLGTAQTVLTTGGTVAASNFSAGSSVYDNTSDAAFPYAPLAKAVLSFTFGTAPVAGTVIELWALFQDVDSTTDETDAPSGTASKGARCVGSFLCTDVTTLQVRECVINAIGLEKAVFYLKNGTGQTMSTGAVLKVTPLTVGLAV